MTSDHPTQADIVQALSRPVDYSSAFIEEIARLCSQLSSSLNVPLIQDDDMNYRASQSLTLWFDSALETAALKLSNADWGLETFISSRAKYFTFACRHKQPTSQSRPQFTSAGAKDTWVLSPLSCAPERVKEYEATIKDDLIRRGYAYLSLDALQDLTEGHRTDLEQLPATYFNVLFSEID